MIKILPPIYAVDATTGEPEATGDLMVPDSAGNVVSGMPPSPQQAIRSLVDAINGAIADSIALALSQDVFYVSPTFTVDGDDTRDQYSCGFFRNGVQFSPHSITSPTLTVVKESDGSAFFGPVALANVSGTDFYLLDQANCDLRLVAGRRYIATFAATINSIPYSRSFEISREGDGILDANASPWRRAMAEQPTAADGDDSQHSHDGNH